MATLPLNLSREDYARASAFVLAHLRRTGATPTSLRPLSVVTAMLYMTALFVVVTAPNYTDGTTRTIIRACVAALLVVPALFAVGVWRLRKADAKALQPLEPSLAESVSISVSAANVEVRTDTMAAQFQWTAVAFFVIEPDFAVFLAPRMAPLPLTPSACASNEAFFEFLRFAQQYKAHNAA